MKNSKRRQLFDHLIAARNLSDKPLLHYAGMSNRLTKTYLINEGTWQDVAHDIDVSVVMGTYWFPDANVALTPAAEIIWEKFRKNSLLLGRPQAIITETVVAEINDWLSNPYHQHKRASEIKRALEHESWLRWLPIDWQPDCTLAVLGYLRILVIRRTLALATSGGTTLLGTDPNDHAGTMKEIGSKLGPRAQGLAKKGRKDMAKHGALSVNDELHGLFAILHALVTETESVILTTDVDFLEIFQKLFWFIDSHYRAMLAAELIRKGKYGQPITTLENTQGYFSGPITLYRRVSNELREVLPVSYRSIPVSVVYLSPDGWVHRFGSQFETNMLNMLRLRARTNGRCTEALGAGQNIHIDLGPLTRQTPELCLGVGMDEGDTASLLGREVFRSRLDAEHALQCNETTTRVS
jgi:hypothetical protein